MSMAVTPATLPKSGAVSKGYNFASAWEKNAPLTEQQNAAISALSHAVAERPFPANLEDGGTTVPEKESALEEAGAMDAVLVNTHQFYKWFAELESAMKSETEEKYRLYESTLEERVNTCDGILKQVDDTLNLFEELQSLHSSVAIKTKTLHDACDQLLVEKQRLIEFAEALRSRLNYFDELENCTSQEDGRTTRRPLAPAFAHRAASVLILSTKVWTDGWAPSKTHSFRCFQISHGVSKVADARPLRRALGVSCFACCHQSNRDASWFGALVGILSQASTSCQVWRERGHSRSRWCMDSGSWSQNRHLGWCCSPCRARRSAVQHLSWLANQWKNLTRGGAHVFQINFQVEQVMEPWKVAR